MAIYCWGFRDRAEINTLEPILAGELHREPYRALRFITLAARTGWKIRMMVSLDGVIILQHRWTPTGLRCGPFKSTRRPAIWDSQSCKLVLELARLRRKIHYVKATHAVSFQSSLFRPITVAAV